MSSSRISTGGGLHARHWSLAALLPIALGIVAASLVLLRHTEYGPGLTPDSARYVSTGRNLFTGDGFAPFYGTYADQPPLFPLILAATGYLHDDTIVAAAALNATAFGLAVCLVAAWLRRRQVSAFLVAWAGFAFALSPLASVAAYVWSETVFVLFALAALFSLDNQLATGTRRALLVSAGFAALCCLTRYAGVGVIACAVALLAVCGRLGLAARLRWASVYAAVGIAPTACWLARNLLVVGLPLPQVERGALGHANPEFPGFRLPDAASETVLGATLGPAVLDWIERALAELGIPAGGDTLADVGTSLALTLAVWGLVVGALGRWGQPGLWRAATVPAVFVPCHLAVVAVALPLGGLHAEPRYVVPIIGPMLVVFALALQACASASASAVARLKRRKTVLLRPLPAAAMAVALSLWLAQWAASNISEVKEWNTHGSDGYGERRWAESETLAWFTPGAAAAGAVGRRSTVVLSNDPAAVYLSARRRPGHLLGNVGIGELERQASPGARVLWFYQPRTPATTGLTSFLSANQEMRLIRAYADGLILQQPARRRLREAEGEQDTDAATRVAQALLRHSREKAQLVATAYFDVYLDNAGRRLTYIRYGCETTDVRPVFFVHVTPQDAANLPMGITRGLWRPRSPGFHNLDFSFTTAGVSSGRTCIATKALPSYAIARIRTGQWVPEPRGTTWSVEFAVGSHGLGNRLP